MNISLTPKLKQFVEQKVRDGLYEDTSDVVRDALRVLQKRECPVSIDGDPIISLSRHSAKLKYCTHWHCGTSIGFTFAALLLSASRVMESANREHKLLGCQYHAVQEESHPA